MPTVCAIIPTYNRSDMLRECLDSLFAQTKLPDEIIVVNDGSSDETAAMIATHYPTVRLLLKENGGKSSALNEGLRATNADYIWICDDDDIAHPEGLETLLNVLKTNPALDFVYGETDMFEMRNGIKHVAPCRLTKRSSEPSDKINFLEGLFTNQFAMIVRREHIKNVGFFREDLIRCQDYEMVLRITRWGHGKGISKPIFLYRQHDAARGTKQITLHINQKENTWLNYDQIILSAIYKNYDLLEFCPTFAENASTSVKQRACLIQRATIMGRRALWDQALDDLSQAAIVSECLLTPDELSLLNLVERPLVWQKLRECTDLHKKYRHLMTVNKNSHVLLTTLARPVLWLAKKSLKERQYTLFFGDLKLYLRLVGVRGVVTFLKKVLSKTIHL